ncbi:hypothetical protein C8J57DRAFT_1224414 [Mycena rebaudengoi]|nr:hypothetical protein C8J57DRAFT_1224414 [Mycena rebaudengoi]
MPVELQASQAPQFAHLYSLLFLLTVFNPLDISLNALFTRLLTFNLHCGPTRDIEAMAACFKPVTVLTYLRLFIPSLDPLYLLLFMPELRKIESNPQNVEIEPM